MPGYSEEADMKKNILITILTLVFCLFMAVPGLAESENAEDGFADEYYRLCLLYTSPSPRD